MGVRRLRGRLFLDFRWQGVRCREYISGPLGRDTAENRRELQKRFDVIKAQIRAGTFDYGAWFPNGTQIARFGGRPRSTDTLAQYLERWQKLRSPYRRDGSIITGRRVLKPSTWHNDGLVIERRLVPAIGHLALSAVTRTELLMLKRRLLDEGGRGGSGLSAKTVNNVMGVLRKALEDAVDEGILRENPSPKLDGGGDLRASPDPFAPDEVALILEAMPAEHRDFYRVWFGTGWRPSELVALRFAWLDWRTQTVEIRAGRNPRWGGVEAGPKTGPREVSCAYDPGIFEAFERRRRASIATGARDYVFTYADGTPLSQEKMHVNVFARVLRELGIRHRGSYAIRDTFITHALSAGEDPGWVARVCGTSETMIFRHYRKWMPGTDPSGGSRLNRRLFGAEMGRSLGRKSRAAKGN